MWNLYRTFRAGPLPISSKPMLRKASGPCEIPQSDQIVLLLYSIIYICKHIYIICMYACVFVFVFAYLFLNV